jgi:small GTP-binding protein
MSDLTFASLRSVLDGKPTPLCVVVAARAVLRTLPLMIIRPGIDKAALLSAFENWLNGEGAAAVLLSAFQCLDAALITRQSVFDSEQRPGIEKRRLPELISRSGFQNPHFLKALTDVEDTNRHATGTGYRVYTGAAAALIESIAAFSELGLSTPIGEAIHEDLEHIRRGVQDADLSNCDLWPSKSQKSPLTYWIDFKKAVLKVAPSFSHWIDWYDDRINGVPLNLEVEAKRLFTAPAEISAQGVHSSNRYVERVILGEANKPLNRVRAIFIGHPSAGKTSLIRRLKGERVVEGVEPFTPGVQIHEWRIPDSPITAHIWDFGGQVIFHTTHQFFLRERCVYVIVLDGRNDFSPHEQAEYWLEHVKAFGNSAPVVLVGNKADQVTVGLDLRRLRDKFPNILGFHALSCTSRLPLYRSAFAQFKRDLFTNLKIAEINKVLFSEDEFLAIEDLRRRSRKSAFLQRSEYEAIVKRRKVWGDNFSTQRQELLLDLLDKLGVVISFPQLRHMSDYLLNPRWLTYGVYHLLSSPKIKQANGLISDDDVVNILSTESIVDNEGVQLEFPPERCGFLLDAMEQFKICYRLLRERNQYIIPALLPDSQPPFKLPSGPMLAFKCSFKSFLPRHVITNMIVDRHSEIFDDTVWQSGVLLKSRNFDDMWALVRADYMDREITLWMIGNGADRYFSVLYDELLQILQRMPQLEYEELVALTNESTSSSFLDSEATVQRLPSYMWARFRQLLAMEKKGPSLYVNELGSFDVSSLLRILPKSEREKLASNLPNTIIVARKDVNVTQIGRVQQFEIGQGHIQSTEVNSTGAVNLSHGDIVKVRRAKMMAVGSEVNQVDGHVQILGQLKNDAYELLKALDKTAADNGISIRDRRELAPLLALIQEFETASTEKQLQMKQNFGSLTHNVKKGAGFIYELLEKATKAGKSVEWWISKFDHLSNLMDKIQM